MKKINADLANRFDAVFQERLWGDKESVSGPGSHKDNPMVIKAIEALDELIAIYKIKSIVDIPCGDFNFLQSLLRKHSAVTYVGLDIVSPLIAKNKQMYPDFHFDVFDIVSDIPPSADLVFTKELIIHLKNEHVIAALENMKKSGSKYLLASNSFGVENSELINDTLGYARPIDLTKAPFNFPEPLWKNWFYGFWDLRNIEISKYAAI